LSRDQVNIIALVGTLKWREQGNAKRAEHAQTHKRGRDSQAGHQAGIVGRRSHSVPGSTVNATVPAVESPKYPDGFM
jgi:hypothetical protein